MEHPYNTIAENCMQAAMANIAQAMYYIRQNDKTWADHELSYELRKVYDFLDNVKLSDYSKLC